MKQQYDIARLHKDCLAWCENPSFHPWMANAEVVRLKRHYHEVVINGSIVAALDAINRLNPYLIMAFAQFIGLDVESYRIKQMTRDEAVRDYLDSIPEGGELVDGWVKYTVNEIVYAITNSEMHWLVRVGECTFSFAYTFLRLDLHDKYMDAV
jgi:hypothetical protein